MYRESFPQSVFEVELASKMDIEWTKGVEEEYEDAERTEKGGNNQPSSHLRSSTSIIHSLYLSFFHTHTHTHIISHSFTLFLFSLLHFLTLFLFVKMHCQFDNSQRNLSTSNTSDHLRQFLANFRLNWSIDRSSIFLLS